MTEEQPRPTSNLVTKQEDKPCGCRLTEYADNRRILSPCLPCGLRAAAQQMAEAGQRMVMAAEALNATALRAGRMG